MKLLLIYFCILFLSCQAVVAQKAVVRGCVTDAKTGEILSDANVLERRSGNGDGNQCLRTLFHITSQKGMYIAMFHVGVCYLERYLDFIRKYGGEYRIDSR